MPETKLHAFKSRDEAHKKLEEILAAGLHPRACCREDLSEDDPYSVWSEGPEPHVLPPDPSGMTDEEMLDKLAARLLAHIEKKAAK